MNQGILNAEGAETQRENIHHEDSKVKKEIPVCSLHFPGRLLGMLMWHVKGYREAEDELLREVPPQGAPVSREFLESVIRDAFLAGVVAQKADPI